VNTNFERSEQKDEWLTPPEIVKALGPFDLDPCSPINRPWPTATKHYTREDNGLMQPWSGRVWLNPPYGTQTGLWLRKLVDHGNGIALTFARTETGMFHEYIWTKATAVFFMRGRISFYGVDGTEAGPAGAPSCLIAYGGNNYEALMSCGLRGVVVPLRVNGRAIG
jgi:hypothetical protein